jgi:hypothetical protein
MVVWWLIPFATRFPERTINDVYPFYRRVDRQVLADAFRPGPEADFRSAYGRVEFKKWQSKRMHLAMHLCRDISANCRLLIGWAAFERNQNLSQLPDELRAGLRSFQVWCEHSRTAAFAVRFRLRWRLMRMALMPFLPLQSFNTLVEHSNTLIEFYSSTEVLANTLSLGYGEKVHQNMLTVLGTLESSG